jgi:hypothetical protein
MGGERTERRPSPHIIRVAGEGGVQPTERLGNPPTRGRRIEAAPRHVLHQPMHREPVVLDLSRQQRDGSEILECWVVILRLRLGDRHIQ